MRSSTLHSNKPQGAIEHKGKSSSSLKEETLSRLDKTLHRTFRRLGQAPVLPHHPVDLLTSMQANEMLVSNRISLANFTLEQTYLYFCCLLLLSH